MEIVYLLDNGNKKNGFLPHGWLKNCVKNWNQLISTLNEILNDSKAQQHI